MGNIFSTPLGDFLFPIVVTPSRSNSFLLQSTSAASSPHLSSLLSLYLHLEREANPRSLSSFHSYSERLAKRTITSSHFSCICMTLFAILALLLATMLFSSYSLRRVPGASFTARLKMSSTMSPKTKSSSPLITLDSSVSHPAYKVIERTLIEEFGVQATMYKHIKSGAEVLSIIAPDENKVFGITLRIPPNDSTGVPHILEHSVLCGSRKFPVKVPICTCTLDHSKCA